MPDTSKRKQSPDPYGLDPQEIARIIYDDPERLRLSKKVERLEKAKQTKIKEIKETVIKLTEQLNIVRKKVINARDVDGPDLSNAKRCLRRKEDGLVRRHLAEKVLELRRQAMKGHNNEIRKTRTDMARPLQDSERREDNINEADEQEGRDPSSEGLGS